MISLLIKITSPPAYYIGSGPIESGNKTVVQKYRKDTVRRRISVMRHENIE
jgi:hypothetical protein